MFVQHVWSSKRYALLWENSIAGVRNHEGCDFKMFIDETDLFYVIFSISLLWLQKTAELLLGRNFIFVLLESL